jgi:hypothetical protein
MVHIWAQAPLIDKVKDGYRYAGLGTSGMEADDAQQAFHSSKHDLDFMAFREIKTSRGICLQRSALAFGRA